MDGDERKGDGNREGGGGALAGSEGTCVESGAC
jgi:hypothetical protein